MCRGYDHWCLIVCVCVCDGMGRSAVPRLIRSRGQENDVDGCVWSKYISVVDNYKWMNQQANSLC